MKSRQSVNRQELSHTSGDVYTTAKTASNNIKKKKSKANNLKPAEKSFDKAAKPPPQAGSKPQKITKKDTKTEMKTLSSSSTVYSKGEEKAGNSAKTLIQKYEPEEKNGELQQKNIQVLYEKKATENPEIKPNRVPERKAISPEELLVNIKKIWAVDEKKEEIQNFSKTDAKFIEVLISIGQKVLKGNNQEKNLPKPPEFPKNLKSNSREVPTEKISISHSAMSEIKAEVMRNSSGKLDKSKNKEKIKMYKKWSKGSKIFLQSRETLQAASGDLKEIWKRGEKPAEKPTTPEDEYSKELGAYRELKKIVNDELMRIWKPYEKIETEKVETEKPEEEKLKPGIIIVKPNPTSYLEKRALSPKINYTSLTQKLDLEKKPQDKEPVPVEKEPVPVEKEAKEIPQESKAKNWKIVNRLEKAFETLTKISWEPVKEDKKVEKVKKVKEKEVTDFIMQRISDHKKAIIGSTLR